jgi:hypothetical protein
MHQQAARGLDQGTAASRRHRRRARRATGADCRRAGAQSRNSASAPASARQRRVPVALPPRRARRRFRPRPRQFGWRQKCGIERGQPQRGMRHPWAGSRRRHGRRIGRISTSSRRLPASPCGDRPAARPGWRGPRDPAERGGEFLFQGRFAKQGGRSSSQRQRCSRASPSAAIAGSSRGPSLAARRRQRQFGARPWALPHRRTTGAPAPPPRRRPARAARSPAAGVRWPPRRADPPPSARAGSACSPDRCPAHAPPTSPPGAASGRRRLNRAPPLGWLPAVSVPPWRSTMP